MTPHVRSLCDPVLVAVALPMPRSLHACEDADPVAEAFRDIEPICADELVAPDVALRAERAIVDGSGDRTPDEERG